MRCFYEMDPDVNRYKDFESDSTISTRLDRLRDGARIGRRWKPIALEWYRGGYKRKIGYATRISLDGIYLHQLDDTVWAQGNTNLSHGCLNLSGENARWYFNFSQPGDVVEVRYTGGPPLTVAQGGDWTVPWAEWVKGSALTPGPIPAPAPSQTVTPAPGP